MNLKRKGMVIRMTNEKAIKILDNMPIPSHYFILDKEPITFEEMAEAIEMAIEALKNERPKGKCKKCKEYRRFGSGADGYCNIVRMTAEGETFINVNENFFCNYFKEADND